MMKSRHLHYPGLVLFALALPATAEVIYSNLQDIAIPATYDGVYLNVETGAWNTDMFNPVAGWDINPYFGGSVLWNSPSFQPVRSGTGEMDSVLNLGSGIIVDAASVISTFVQGPSGDNPGGPGYGGSETHLGAGPGQFAVGDEGYLGFKLNGINYGWMRVIFTDNAGGALIKDWAYDNNGGAIATGNVLQSGSTVTLDSAFGSFTLGSQLTGSVGVVKTGTGTTTLAANNHYSGTTAINQGTLLINGDQSAATGAITVGSGGTLGGLGITGASVTLNSLGTLSAGDGGIDSLYTGDNTWNGNSTVIFKFSTDGSTGSAGSEWDLVSITGGLDLTGASSGNPITLGLITMQDASNSGLLDTWDPNADATWTSFITTTDGIDGFAADLFGFDVSAFQDSLNGNFSVALNGTNLDLVYTVIPESPAALLGGLGLLMLLRRRR